MSESQAVLDKVRVAYTAWGESKGGSVAAWLELMGDHIDFRSLANGQPHVPWTRSHTTPDGVRIYLDGLLSAFRMEHFTVERYICEGDTIVVVAECAWTNKVTGRRIEMPKVDIWRFRNGKAIAFHEFYDTAQVASAMAA
jgi:ketosteroid isomerase-like protein